MRCLVFAVVLSVMAGACCQSDLREKSDEPGPELVVTGPFVGQEPPGNTPQLFGPGFVSTALPTRDLAMMPDGLEIYFSVVVGGQPVIMVTRQVDDVWTTPMVTSFSGRHFDIEPWISPDGGKLYFMSNRPSEGQKPKDGWGYQDLWVMDRLDDGWGEPRSLGAPVNTERPEFFPSVTRSGVLYFTREDEEGVSWIYRAQPQGEGFAEPERLGAEVNCGTNRFNASIAPDESFIIVPAMGREDSLGGVDYYVVFRSEDDRWSEPINMGAQINQAQGREWSASLSPDGRFLFFMSSRSLQHSTVSYENHSIDDLLKIAGEPGRGGAGIWWIDAGVIEELRPEGF